MALSMFYRDAFLLFTFLSQKSQKTLTFMQSPCILNTERQMFFPIRTMVALCGLGAGRRGRFPPLPSYL